MPTVYLIHGYIGAGKTTFAKQLEERTQAILLSHDAFSREIYGANPPAEVYQSGYANISNLIWKLTARLVKNGQSVVLDAGFWSRTSRDDARARIAGMGAKAKLYTLNPPEKVMLERALHRSHNLPEGALEITAETFETLKAQFQPLEADELAESVTS